MCASRIPVTGWTFCTAADKDQITLRQNTRSMTKDQILLLMHDLHGETDLALQEKDVQIGVLQGRLDSLARQQDSLTAALRTLMEERAAAENDGKARAAERLAQIHGQRGIERRTGEYLGDAQLGGVQG